MTILSLPAVARLAERRVREAGPVTQKQLVEWLTWLDVPQDRAEAGARLAVTTGRLELAEDSTYRIPEQAERAA